MTLESKDIRFRKAEFVAKTQFLFAVEFFIYPCCMAGILGISQPQSKKPQIISSRSADFSNISQPQSTKQQLISSHSACTSSISQPQCRNPEHILAAVQISQAYPSHSAGIPSIFASRGCLANSSHCSWILIASHTLKRTNQNLTL